jgi:GTPase SAR1 family protein
MAEANIENAPSTSDTAPMDAENDFATAGASGDSASSSCDSSTTAHLPTCIIVLGMAGSGKTTFVQRLTKELYGRQCPPYVVNLDPACREVPYPANIDIRDTVNYKQVMKQYQLGPNGGIVTSLNLFATKFDQVEKILLLVIVLLRYCYSTVGPLNMEVSLFDGCTVLLNPQTHFYVKIL